VRVQEVVTPLRRAGAKFSSGSHSQSLPSPMISQYTAPLAPISLMYSALPTSVLAISVHFIVYMHAKSIIYIATNL